MGETKRPSSARRRWLWSGVRILVLLTMAVLLIGCLENRFIFFPMRYPEGDWAPAERSRGGVRVEDVYLTAEDGVKLHGWYCSLEGSPDEPRPVMLWLHGNAGNITHRHFSIGRFVRFPADVFIIDYRGYGRSEGTPSEEGVYRDAAAAWRYLIEERGIAPERIVLFGRSLGAAVAIELATREDIKPAGLVVESAFTCIADMAGRVLPLYPRFLLRNRFDSVGKIERVAVPKLFVHGTDDEIIPFEHGRQLYERARQPKRFVEVPGATHNETEAIGGIKYYEAVGAFVRDVVAPPQGADAAR